MLSIIDKSKCSGCHACAAVCPKQCIEMKKDKEGFLYPHIREADCVQCHKCETVCPILTHKCSDPNSMQLGYAAINRDDAIRSESSSGGIFTLMAEAVIQKGGAVIGAAMTEDFREVKHIVAEKAEELPKLRGSKYVQSDIGGIFPKVKQILDSGRAVLFTGTPCQISGLFAYLEKPYDNLFTQDLICHGVPSQVVWKEYIKHREKKAGSRVASVNFRNKQLGWKRFSMFISFANGKYYSSPFRDDAFMRGFLANIYLRPSCYNCSYKTQNRQADITLADFWGCGDVVPKMDDDKGLSVLWIHSQKGVELIDQISDEMICKEINIKEALNRNRSALYPPKPNKNRNIFWNSFPSDDIDKYIKSLSNDTVVMKAKKVLGKVKKRILRMKAE